MLAFVKRPLADEVVVLLHNCSIIDEDDTHGEEEGVTFSRFSTSLCSLEVSDVGVVVVAIVIGREDGLAVSETGALAKVEKGDDNWEWLDEA